MKMSIVILAVISACIFTDLEGQEFSLVASADNFDGSTIENPLSSPYAMFRSANRSEKKDTRFFSTLVNKANRKAKVFDLELMEKITFYPKKFEIVNASTKQEMKIHFPIKNKIRFSVENYNGYNYSLIDISKGEKVQLGKISDGEIEVSGISGGQYLLIVHQEDEFHSQLIRIE